MRLSIADDLWATHPGHEWYPPRPTDLPPLDEIRDAEAYFAQVLTPVSRAAAAKVLRSLVDCFTPKWDDAEARIQLDTWLAAIGDLPGDLWTEGATELMRTHTWGMPKPPHLLEKVSARFEQRKVGAQRVRRLLTEAGRPPKPEPLREPIEVRLRASIWRGWNSRINNPTFLTPVLWQSAMECERTLASIEKREPAAWAIPEAVVERVEPPKRLPRGWKLPVVDLPLPADEVMVDGEKPGDLDDYAMALQELDP